MKKDIYSREDVELLVDTFYEKVKANAIIGYIFNDIAKVDWKNHLPRMYSFWASILLGEHSFSGNPMNRHIQLSKIAPMTDKEFSEWLKIFTQTTDDLFEGEKSEDAKTRASNIARLMLHKINTSQPN